jgi:hypothetical protein
MMHFPTLFTSSLVICLVSCHGGVPGAPQIFGRRTVKKLKEREVWPIELESSEWLPEHTHKLSARQRTTTCGAGIGSCAAGLCCSVEGFCGTGKDSCEAPDCQFQYGPACDANSVPAGESTSSVPRPKVGSVAYGGAGIYDCIVSTEQLTPFARLLTGGSGSRNGCAHL